MTYSKDLKDKKLSVKKTISYKTLLHIAERNKGLGRQTEAEEVCKYYTFKIEMLKGALLCNLKRRKPTKKLSK